MAGEPSRLLASLKRLLCILLASSSAMILREPTDSANAMALDDMPGVDDVPALAAAYVGRAIGSSTDVAIKSADVTLIRDEPRGVVTAIRIFEGTLSKIKQNFFWYFGYNMTLILLASLGLLQPVLAVGPMALSSASVLTNSLLFRHYMPDHNHELLGFSANNPLLLE